MPRLKLLLQFQFPLERFEFGLAMAVLFCQLRVVGGKLLDLVLVVLCTSCMVGLDFFQLVFEFVDSCCATLAECTLGCTVLGLSLLGCGRKHVEEIRCN